MTAAQKPIAMIVTSDKATMESCRQVLEKAGYDVIEQATGLDGLLAMGQHIDLVLCDRELDVIDGLKFAVEIRKMPLPRHVPIVMLVPPERNLESAFIVGVDEAMYKPVDPDRLLRVCACLMTVRGVKNAIERRNEYQRLLARTEAEARMDAARRKRLPAALGRTVSDSRRTVRAVADAR